MLVIMAVKRRSRLQTNVNILLVCLAVTDALTGLTTQFFVRALEVKAVLSIFSPIVRISPPLGQMCLNVERDVRKGHRAKYPKIRGNVSIVNRENG